LLKDAPLIGIIPQRIMDITKYDDEYVDILKVLIINESNLDLGNSLAINQ